MAENPLRTIARLLGGVVLMQGNLGHQVLGQLLVMNTNEVALAGASAVIAGTTRQKNAVGQIALRTAAPALAARMLIQRDQARLERQAALLKAQEARLAARTQAVERGESELNAHRGVLTAAGATRLAVADEQKRQLQSELERVSTELRSLEQRASKTRGRSGSTTRKASRRKTRSPKRKRKG